MQHFIGCQRKGIDYFGGDILSERANNPSECATKCREVEDCKTWSFVKIPKTGDCILKKGSNISIAANPNCISGFQNSWADICGANGTYSSL